MISCKFPQVRGITPERGLTQNVNNFEKVQIYLLCNYSHRGTCFLFQEDVSCSLMSAASYSETAFLVQAKAEQAVSGTHIFDLPVFAVGV